MQKANWELILTIGLFIILLANVYFAVKDGDKRGTILSAAAAVLCVIDLILTFRRRDFCDDFKLLPGMNEIE